ncbi:Ankyrin repeat-containing domain [Trinorchestia longiramus]|nr:Ankyrin repeat-containing domain [Trinorchestia longiramus]
MYEVIVYEVIMYEVNMHEVIMHEVIMHEVIMHEVIMHEVIMHEVIMHEVIMHEVIMHEAIMHEAIMCEVIICEVIMCEAIMCEVIMCEVIMCEVIMCEVIMCEGGLSSTGRGGVPHVCLTLPQASLILHGRRLFKSGPRPGGRRSRASKPFACTSFLSDLLSLENIDGGSSALLRAACEGRVQVIRLLLRHGANVDHQDSLHGNTGLHEACWKGYSESCAVLVKARAHLHLKNKGGFAPLHLACQNGHNQSCRVLLLAACDPNIKNNYGDTPLHTAARYGHAGVTRILLSAQADVHISNKNGDSCLHIAAAMGRRKLTKIMLEAGAVQTGRNKQGETPQDIARRKQFNQILEILQHPPAVVSPEERLKKEREQAKKESTSEKDSKRQKNKTDGKERGNKREKNDSGTSSRDSSTRPKDKKKMRGECRERGAEGCLGGVHWSPYGCHNYSAAPLQLPHVDADALPKGVLKAGEQYYVDLAGNVKKGPVAVKGSCYCAPFFRQVEHKLETDKVALMDHIDAHHEKLDKRIHSLEKKTHTHLNNIKQTVQHKICEGREECLQRVAESVTERDERLAAHKRNLQQWVEKRLEVHDSALPPLIRRTLTRTGSGRWRDPPAGHHSLARSRSEEALTEATSDLNESSYRGLRVLDHPTSMYNLHQEVDDEDTTHVYKVGASPLQSSVGVVTDRRVASDKILAKSEDEIFNEDPGRLCVIEDSSDSEGEQELPAQDASSYRINDSSSQLAQDIEKLSLDHPYYANTGAIPKSIGCSWPQSSSLTGSSTTKEIVRVDVHVPRDMVPHNKWHTYSRYEPHSNRNHLYDVQEVEPSYGNVPQSNDLEQVRDSGCSEGSSQTDIGESEQPPFSTGHEMAVPATSASSHMQDKMTPSTDGRRQIEGHLKDQVKEVSFHRDWKEISHQQQNSTEYNKHYYTAAPQKDETATYLDMDRYRIQQAVRRLYDGYLTDGRVDPRRGKAALESSLEHDSHNDSGYSTRMCTASQGPSPALSGASGVPDGSGSESRSGHSTSSPNTTVIAFPQGASTSNPSYHPASKLVVYDSSATHSPIKTYSTKNYTDDDPNGKENFKTQYSQFGHDTHSSIAPRNDNYRPLSGAVSDKHRALPAAGAAKLYPAAGHYSAPQATQQPGQRSCTRNMLDVITVGESSLV